MSKKEWEHQKYSIEKYKDRSFFGLLFPTGTGKEQPLSSKILTKYGYITMHDVKIGDKIIDGEGKECSVTGIFPQGIKQVYRVTFSDNTYIRVGAEHLNRFIRHSTSKCHKCKDEGIYKLDLTTTELIRQFNTKRYNFWCQLPVCEFNSDFTEEELPLDPYLLGFLIGDGCLKYEHKYISVSEKDLVNKLKDKVKLYDCHLVYAGGVDFGITRNKNSGKNTIAEIINSLALNAKAEDKYIPPLYLYASVNQRLNLLRGLFDSDGHVTISAKGGCSFEWSTVSRQLSEDFSFLVRTLGCVDKVIIKQPYYTDKQGRKIAGKLSYRHFIKVPNNLLICSSEKHLARIKPRQSEPMRKVISITEDGKEECQCIMVDSPDHTYITDNVTVTHNTFTATRIAEQKERPVLIIAPNALCKQWADELTNKEEDKITTKDWNVLVCSSKTKHTVKFKKQFEDLCKEE